MAAAFAAYVALSVVRHETFRSTGFDLALFEQVIRHYSQLEAPASAIKGLDSIFQDHVSPIMALLAPIYALWSSAVALLVAQAAVVAASAVPIYAFAKRRIERSGALMLAAAYLLFGGLQEGIRADIHEVAFAPLLIASAIAIADRGRWTASFLCSAALLLVKEDLSFLVAAIGIWYALSGQRRLGVATVALGVGWYLLVTHVAVPDYAYDEGYRLSHVVDVEWAKVRTVGYLFGAFFGLSLLSPLAVLTVPLLAERMSSVHPNYWTLENHYSLTIAPVLALAAADGLMRLGPVWRRRALRGMVVVGLALTPALPLGDLLRPSSYRSPPAYRAARQALSLIPATASVAATNRLAPHLDGRPELTLLGSQPSHADYVIAATTDAAPEGTFPFRDLADLRTAVHVEATRRPELFARDGIVLVGPVRP